MKIAIYSPAGERLADYDLPDGVFQACVTLDGWMARQSQEVSVYGLGRVIDRDVRIAELEAAIDKLAQCKGRFHTEANFKALVAVREKNLHK